MGNTRSESSLGILAGDLCGRTSGSIYRGQRTGKEMDRKKQTKPQARRDSDGTLCGSLHGDQGSTASSTGEAINATAIETTAAELPVEAGRVDTEETLLAKVVIGMPMERSRTFTARPCSNCNALRPTGTNYTRVYATRGDVRYCKCHYCGTTWKDSEA